MSKGRIWLLTTCLLLIILTAASACVAAEEEQSPADTPTGAIFRWLNFAIVVGVLGYLFWKQLLPGLRGRAEGIRRAIAAGSEARADAEEQLRSIEAKLARLDDEVAALRTTAEQESKGEAARIRSLARDEVAKIQHAAQAEIEAAERAARIELRRLGVQVTVSRAESLIREQINAATRTALFQSFLADLERRAN